MSDDATAALTLLSRMRFACGDNGLRMQDELEQYLIELRRDADAELWRALLKKLESDQYQQFCVKFGDVLKAEIAVIDSARGVG